MRKTRTADSAVSASDRPRAKNRKCRAAVEGLVDREPAEERRQREVVPGRVMLEEVPVGKQAPEHAPGRVRVLELVGVEEPNAE